MRRGFQFFIILFISILLIDAGVGFDVSNAASKPKHKHKYKVIKLKKPTCTRKGKRILKCKICGKSRDSCRDAGICVFYRSTLE